MSRIAKYLLFLLLMLCCVLAGAQAAERMQRGNLVMEGIPEIPGVVRERLRQYQNTRSASFADWAPDGDAMLISTRFGETSQLHRLDQPMGARRQLTFYREPVYTGDYRPVAGQRRILLARDRGGDENYQIYVFDETDGSLAMVSDGSQRKGAPQWSEDGARMSWYTTIEGSPDWGIVVAEAGNPASRRMVYRGQGAFVPVDWAPDNRRLLLQKYISIVESELYILDTATGETSRINPSDEKIAYGGAEFAPDGEALYFTSNEHGQFMDLVRYCLENGDQTVLTGAIDWDVENLDVSPGGQSLAFSVNADTRSVLHLRTADNKPLPAPILPPGIISGLKFSPDGKALALTFNTATSPGDVWSWELGSASLTRWTESEVGGLDTGRFVTPDFFHYQTFDERDIPAFIYRPAGQDPHPVVIAIHGGPEGQARPWFSAVYQYWVNELGIAVVVPNVRGSAGYGTDNLLLDNGRKREDSVKDIGALLDWIAAQPDLDEERVMVYGGSYGGYMVLASMVHFNDRLAGGVDIVGISNFVTFLENTRDYRRELRRVEYGDESDPAMRRFLQSISPLNHAEKITKPLFIIQGANDPRVPASESGQMLEKVKQSGAGPWFLMALDEGHGFRKKSNRDFMTEAIVLFFRRHLLVK